MVLLADGDKKAYSENSQWAMKQNKDVISQLRSENKQLRAKLSKRMKARVILSGTTETPVKCDT